MFTFEEARNHLARGRRGFSRPLGNNTWLEVDGDDFVIRHHATNIIRIHENGTYTLDVRGWQSVTTKARLGEYSPARIYSLHGTWLVQVPADMQREGQVLAYRNGMTFDATGRPLNVRADDWQAPPKRYRRKTVRRVATPRPVTLFG
jgi:hypothetical protein